MSSSSTCSSRLLSTVVWMDDDWNIEQDLPGTVGSLFSSIFVLMTSKCSFTTFDFGSGFGLSTVVLKKSCLKKSNEKHADYNNVGVKFYTQIILCVFSCVFFTCVFSACFSHVICVQYGRFTCMKCMCNAAMPVACTVLLLCVVSHNTFSQTIIEFKPVLWHYWWESHRTHC